MDDAASSSSSADSYASGASVVYTTPENQSRLDHERSKIHWMPREHSMVPLTFTMLILEREIAHQKAEKDIDPTYCDRVVLVQLMDTKAYIKRACAGSFDSVRKRHNEFEFNRGAIFHHGAAIKMANIDALMEHELTNPKGPNGATMIGPNEPLYFADMYGGPGGCAEYFLWKKKWHAKGFGISPRGRLDYNLLQAEHFPVESFEPYYGDNGIKGTGDIHNPYNIAKFAQFVRQSTGGCGVHFAVGSGGDQDDSADEDIKEVRCKYLFLSEFLCALQIVRPGGHYVCRIYDSYTAFTVGLIYLMFRCFEKVAIVKPESSLPASSERYVICKWRKTEFHTREVINYLSDCHRLDWHTMRSRRSHNSDEPADIIQLVGHERIQDASSFVDYITRVNTQLGRQQYHETKFLLAKIRDNKESQYVNERLCEIQMKCNEQWKIPKVCRVTPKYGKASTAELRAMKLITPYPMDFYRDCEQRGEYELTMKTLARELTNPKEWVFCTVGRMRGFFLCLGGTKIYHFGGAKWNAVKEKIELMNNTLVYADLVDEIKVNGANRDITAGFHIIDALILGGKDIRDTPTDERFDLIYMFAQSMNKASRPDLAKIRIKPHYDLKFFHKHMKRVTESGRIRSRDADNATRFLAPVSLHGDEGLVYSPQGILFMKIFRDKFAPADTSHVLLNRCMWHWTNDTDLKAPESLHESRDGDVEMIDVDRHDVCTARSILLHLDHLGV